MASAATVPGDRWGGIHLLLEAILFCDDSAEPAAVWTDVSLGALQTAWVTGREGIGGKGRYFFGLESFVIQESIPHARKVKKLNMLQHLIPPDLAQKLKRHLPTGRTVQPQQDSP